MKYTLLLTISAVALLTLTTPTMADWWSGFGFTEKKCEDMKKTTDTKEDAAKKESMTGVKEEVSEVAKKAMTGGDIKEAVKEAIKGKAKEAISGF